MKRFSEQDQTWMRRALELARRGEGLTRPNPPVGAVLVKNGRIIGEGWHRRAGGPHAEIHALRQAGPAARNSTLYVTLEPCSTQGRTPPCTEAILQTGIRRVVVAVTDPNPRHAGRGLRILRKAGLRVQNGLCAADGRSLIAPFTTLMTRHRPFLTLKLGITLDGRIADSRHASRWITGPQARREVQAMRRAADAILIGAGTLLHDNPSLRPRPARGRDPWRIILAGKAPLPLSSQVFTDTHAARTLVAAPKGWHPARARAIRTTGATVWELPKRDSLPNLARKLGELGILKVLCEGGGGLAGSLIRARWMDELILFLSPKVLGGPVGATGCTTWPLAEAPEFRLRESRPVGRDLLLHLDPVREEN